MRILFCNYEYPPLGGGGGVVNALVAEELAATHDVTVLTSHALDLPQRSMVNGVKVVRVPVFFRKQKSVATLLSMLAFVPLGIKAGRRLLAAESFDVINTHFVIPTGPVGDALARSAGIPNVLSLHGGDLYDPSKLTSPHHNPLLRVWIRRLLERADIVVGQSTNTLENMRRYYAPNLDGHRVPLGIRRPEGDVARRSDYGFADDDILLVTVGRLIARKATNQLIAIMAALRDEKVRLLIVGSGPKERLLRAEAVRHGVDNRVLFLGQVEETEKFRILRTCDLYVSTSQHEGFGLVFLEAMACGLPIVSYNHGGQTDFLKDQTTGYLVPLNDQNLFTQRCALLIDDTKLRESIGAYNQCLVEEYYVDRCAAAYVRLFNAVLAAKADRQHALARRGDAIERKV